MKHEYHKSDGAECKLQVCCKKDYKNWELEVAVVLKNGS
jgi:hypothetical protein